MTKILLIRNLYVNSFEIKSIMTLITLLLIVVKYNKITIQSIFFEFDNQKRNAISKI